jgi:hypothetical protein
MTTIHVTPRQLAGLLKQQQKDFPRAVTAGLRAGARRGLAHLPGKTPTDMGQLRNSWKMAGDRVPRLFNDAPHAGIVEQGARPHRVSAEGMEALQQWAMRKLGVDEVEAKRIAQAIAWRLRTRGQAPTFFVRAEIPELLRLAEAELDREMKKAIEKPPRGKR